MITQMMMTGVVVCDQSSDGVLWYLQGVYCVVFAGGGPSGVHLQGVYCPEAPPHTSLQRVSEMCAQDGPPLSYPFSFAVNFALTSTTNVEVFEAPVEICHSTVPTDGDYRKLHSNLKLEPN